MKINISSNKISDVRTIKSVLREYDFLNPLELRVINLNMPSQHTLVKFRDILNDSKERARNSFYNCDYSMGLAGGSIPCIVDWDRNDPTRKIRVAGRPTPRIIGERCHGLYIALIYDGKYFYSGTSVGHEGSIDLVDLNDRRNKPREAVKSAVENLVKYGPDGI